MENTDTVTRGSGVKHSSKNDFPVTNALCVQLGKDGDFLTSDGITLHLGYGKDSKLIKKLAIENNPGTDRTDASKEDGNKAPKDIRELLFNETGPNLVSTVTPEENLIICRVQKKGDRYVLGLPPSGTQSGAGICSVVSNLEFEVNGEAENIGKNAAFSKNQERTHLHSNQFFALGEGKETTITLSNGKSMRLGFSKGEFCLLD